MSNKQQLQYFQRRKGFQAIQDYYQGSCKQVNTRISAIITKQVPFNKVNLQNENNQQRTLAVLLLTYLLNLTPIPIIVPVSLIIMPADTRTGAARPNIRVTVLRGLGNLDGDNVASNSPSGKQRMRLLRRDDKTMIYRKIHLPRVINIIIG